MAKITCSTQANNQKIRACKSRKKRATGHGKFGVKPEVLPSIWLKASRSHSYLRSSKNSEHSRGRFIPRRCQRRMESATATCVAQPTNALFNDERRRP
eukprot:3822584-Rhodomonas_salina.2